MAAFDAFISYSRQASGTLAAALRNGIERFAKPWYRLRSSRVFLDDASMSANTGLWSNIERGLTEADWFILLCSPSSAASQYVTTEIAWWLEHKSSDRILMVLDEGEIAWDATSGDFDWPRATAVNPALTRAFAEEPRWVDLSWFELDDSLRDADPRFPERVADLAAAIRFQERDELVGENVRERRRALRLLRGGVVALSVLLVASLIATVLAVRNGNAATEQARIALARQLAAQAITLSRTDLQTASLLAAEANRLSDDAQTRAALFQLATASPTLVRALPAGAVVTATAVSADGTVLTGDAAGEVELWRSDGSEVMLTFPDRVVAVAMSADHRILAAISGMEAAVWSEGRLEQLDLASAGWDDSLPTDVSISADGRYLAVSNPTTVTSVFEAVGGGYVGLGSVPRGGQVGWATDEFTVVSALGEWARVSLDGLAVLDSGWHAIPMSLSGSAVSADGRIMAGQPAAGVNYALWYAQGSVSGGDSTGGDLADLVVTSQVSAPLDLELDEHGARLAMLVDGTIYVATARDPAALPEQPLVLDGAGRATPSTLSFAGDHLASGSGEFALLWDLRQAGRIVAEVETSVAEPCRACGPPFLRISPDGSRALTTDLSGNDTYVTEVATGATVRVEDADGGYSGATWIDEDRIIGYSVGAGALRILSGTGFSVDASIPVDLDPGAYAVLAIHTDGVDSATILDESGLVQVVDLASGTVTASTGALREAWEGSAPYAFGIAADRSTAFVTFGTAVGYVDLENGEPIYRGAADGAAYDGASELHVFADGVAWTVDRDTGELVAPNPAAVEPIPAPVLSPDGRIVVTGGLTGTMSLVALDGRGSVFGRIGVPVETDRYAVSAFTADGSALLTAIQSMGERPAALRRLDLTREGWRTAACALAGRDLTPDEWRSYLGTEPPADLRCGR
ncbi:MAG: toll/interleukin-1 receptor domain-containing protein [Propionicimonas sp.]